MTQARPTIWVCLAALAALTALTACDALIDPRYGGPALVRLRGTASGFGADDAADAAALHWNTQRGTDLTAGPRSAIPLESAPPSAFALLVLTLPPEDVYFSFDGEDARVAEAALLLTDGDEVVGEAVSYVLVHVAGNVTAGSLAAGYLGEPLAPGFHVRDKVATAAPSPAQAALAARCGGGEACQRPRRYQLAPVPTDLSTELVFIRRNPVP
jgi:hypothetical protein